MHFSQQFLSISLSLSHIQVAVAVQQKQVSGASGEVQEEITPQGKVVHVGAVSHRASTTSFGPSSGSSSPSVFEIGHEGRLTHIQPLRHSSYHVCITKQSREKSNALFQVQESKLDRELKTKLGGSKVQASDFWETRYNHGGNSGQGSYGQLAAYKADVLNKYVAEQQIAHVVELGCGDGNQLTLAKYPEYTGLDVSSTALKTTGEKFRNDPSKHFLLYDGATLPAGLQGDLSMSLDVLYHLTDPQVYQEYLDNLFSLSSKHVIIYASNTSQWRDHHVVSRAFTEYIALRYPCWELEEHLPKPKIPGAWTEFFIYRKKKK